MVVLTAIVSDALVFISISIYLFTDNLKEQVISFVRNASFYTGQKRKINLTKNARLSHFSFLTVRK